MRGLLRLNLLLLLSATSDASNHASNGWLKLSSSSQHVKPSTRKAIFHVSGGAKAPVKNAKKGAKVPAISNPDGASIPNEVFNLVKAIVGVGVLSLPAGIAAFADAKSACVPAAAMIAVIGVLSGYGFAIIGKVCAYTGATSYREAWAKSVGPKTSWIPAWSAMLKTSMACLAYSMVLGDTFSSLLGTPRTPTLVGITILILLPLCLLKNLKSLAPFSLLGVMGMAYTALAMTVRWLDGSYAPSGSLVGDIAKNLRPSFGSVGGLGKGMNFLILLCMLSTAYMVRS
jgi:Transmembrane amino acid transporter protein